MATSSVTHNFVITDPKSVRRFIKAIENSGHNRKSYKSLPGCELTSSQEILDLMAKRKR